MDEQQAREALAKLEAAQARLAARTRWSPARHAAPAALIGAMVASYALGPGLQMGLFFVCIALIGIIAMRDRKRDGFFVNGYRAGRTRRVTFAAVAVATALMLAALLARHMLGWRWMPPVLGVVAFAATFGASIVWERVYRRELERDR